MEAAAGGNDGGVDNDEEDNDGDNEGVLVVGGRSSSVAEECGEINEGLRSFRYRPFLRATTSPSPHHDETSSKAQVDGRS